MDYDEIEEGSPCTERGCSGAFMPSDVVGCSCHIAPPCSACTNAGYTCNLCGYDTAPYEEPERYIPPRREAVDRSKEVTYTRTDNPFNSTPFTACCSTAAINTDRCPLCNAQITYHDDGLAEVRRLAKGGCLMCFKPLPKKHLGEPGTCCC